MTNDDALPCKEAVELVTEYLEKVMKEEEWAQKWTGTMNHRCGL
jgi:hypothetical protein